ncbi:MAG: glycosyltransferase 87 family protein [Rhodospirillales bacterium]|nr:glycosyltransferase 87 family protein [Rhodospirillales bacterium]
MEKLSRPHLVTLAALPLALFNLEMLLRHQGGAFWIWHLVDPSYFYLLNGLMLAVGETPADVFHPGTPVHVLVAAVLRLFHPFLSADDLALAVLAEPEKYLKRISFFIMLLNAGALYFLGRSALRTFGRLLPAMAAQAAPFATMFVLKHSYQVKPEPFLLLAASLMGLCLFEAMRKPTNMLGRLPIAFGLVAGFGAASKLLFAPIALTPLFLLATRRNIALYAAAAAAAFLVCLLPAAGNWDVSLAYFTRMAAGSGSYGGGPATFIDWSSYPSNLAKVFAGKPIFVALLLLSLAALAWRWKRRMSRGNAWKALEGIVLAELAMALLVAKHPIAYYMLAAVSLIGVQAALLIVLGEELLGKRNWWQPAMIALLCVIGLSRLSAFLSDIGELNVRKRQALAVDMKSYEACTQVYFDFASNPAYALYMGDMMAGWRWSEKLAAMYPAPNMVFMNFFTGDPRRWGEKIDLQAEFAKRPCAVLRGAWDYNMKTALARFAPDFKLESQCQAGQEFLFASGLEAKCGK